MAQREKENKKTVGLVLGKFMPPHMGHAFLFDFAKTYCDETYILVCTRPCEPIEGNLRYDWIKQSWPDLNVIHYDKDIPQEPSEHKDFWKIWKDMIHEEVPANITHVFASEDYGNKLSEVLKAKYIPVDLNRGNVDMSATKIRENPQEHFDYILPLAKNYFQKTICIVGPESTGKSTLTEKLAKHYNGIGVQEYARGYIDNKGSFDEADLAIFAKGQQCAIESAKKQQRAVVITDTDAIITQVYHELYYDAKNAGVRKSIEDSISKQNIDLYLVMAPTVPWVDDGQRDLPHKRDEFLEKLVSKLEDRNLPYKIVSDPDYTNRFTKATTHIGALV